MTVTFGDCRFDIDARRLIRDGREAHLSPKAFELLKLLIENRPRAFAKSELLERIWPDVFVSDGSLAKVVNEIRDVVGPVQGSHVIRTVHRFGYAFDAEVVEETSEEQADDRRGQVSWWLICGRREFALADGRHVAGRAPESSIALDSPKVSRHHAEIVVDGVLITVRDLDSKNGTYVRDTRITQPTRLESGDEIRIGPFTLIVRRAMGGLTETEVERGAS
jgi:DNA-binding winged helix-turn-helix (wHTH) protein